jgi:hypothetical protein
MRNPKPLKHKSYESPSLDLFLFVHIVLIYITKEMPFN